jgi:hypothetical protein
MQPFVLLAAFLFGLIVVGLAIVLVVALRKARTGQEPAALGKHLQGYGWVLA